MRGFIVVYSCVLSYVSRYPGGSVHNDFLRVLTLGCSIPLLFSGFRLCLACSSHTLLPLQTFIPVDCVAWVTQLAGSSSNPILVSNLTFCSLNSPLCSTYCLGWLLSSDVTSSYISVLLFFLYNLCITLFGGMKLSCFSS